MKKNIISMSIFASLAMFSPNLAFATTTPAAGFIFIDNNNDGLLDNNDVKLTRGTQLKTLTFYNKVDENGIKFTPEYLPEDIDSYSVEDIVLHLSDDSYHTDDATKDEIDYVLLMTENFPKLVITKKEVNGDPTDPTVSHATYVEKNKNGILAYIPLEDYVGTVLETPSTEENKPFEMRLNFGLKNQELTAIDDNKTVPELYSELKYYVIENDLGDLSDLDCLNLTFDDGNFVPDKKEIGTSNSIASPERNDNLLATLSVVGEGSWTFSEKICGEAIFTPEDGYQGVPSPVKYSLKTYHNSNSSGLLTLNRATHPIDTLKDVKDVNSSDLVNPITIDVLPNDSGDILQDSVRLISFEDGELIKSGDASVDSVNNELNLTVENEGVWTVDDGHVVFTSVPDLNSSPESVYYVVTSEDGTKSKLTEITLNVEPAIVEEDCNCDDFVEAKVPFGSSLLLLLIAPFLFLRKR